MPINRDNYDFRSSKLNAQLDIEEKRRLKRFSVRKKVYSQQTDALIGYAENIHTEGLMIATKKPIRADQKMYIWFGTAKNDKVLSRIFVTAYRVWASVSTSKKCSYYSGLQFVGTSENTVAKIETLIIELDSETED